MDNIDEYLRGDKLYGNDFDLLEIEKWYNDEKEAYADLGAKNKEDYSYAYHQLNNYLGYSHLLKKKYKRVLGFGSAYGDELFPILDKIEEIVIIDPSDSFVHENLNGIPCKYIKPSINGELPFDDHEFDLVVCLGVLHHIPNVSKVISELHRCMVPNGEMLLREPIVSMGDWRSRRSGLTKRERGISLEVFNDFIKGAGLIIENEKLCVFPVITRISSMLNMQAYNSIILTRLDVFISRLFSWNVRYHTTKWVHKFRPSSIYYHLSKPA